MKQLLVGTVLATSILFMSGCGNEGIALAQVMKKGLVLQKGMTKNQVQNTLKKDPDSIERVGKFELWTYEGIITNKDTEESKYKNLTIKFKDGKVDYIGYFSCKLPKKED
jgi:PBP1b-binding outer membrane lipoprotein LpoB